VLVVSCISHNSGGVPGVVPRAIPYVQSFLMKKVGGLAIINGGGSTSEKRE